MGLLDRMIGEADACRKSSDNNNFHIAKADEDQRLVFGWALVSERTDGETIIDHQGDIVDPDELEKGAYEYVLKFRDAGEEHIGTLRKKAKMVESCVFTPEKMKALGIPEGTVPVGWWIGFHVDDDRTWELIKNGTYNMFSIEGKAVREPVNEPVAKNAYDEWLESNLDNFSGEKDERDFANWKSKHGTPKYATDIDVVDMLYEEYRGNTVAKTFSEVLKFNPYHDKLGRFTSGSGGNYASFTYAPGKSKAHDNAIAREKERAAQRSNAASGPKPMTEDEYLGSKGLSSPVSDWTLDKVRIPHGETDRQKKKRIAEGKKAAEEYQRKREQAKQEYKEKVKAGELRDKTSVERMIDRANGHPDNPSTQAARRIAEKRGIDWRTGKPLKDTQSGASHATSNKIKQEFIDHGLNSKFAGIRRRAQEGTEGYSYKDASPVSANEALKMKDMHFVERNGKTLVHGTVDNKKVFFADSSDSDGIKALHQKNESRKQKQLEDASHRVEDPYKNNTTTYDRWKKNHDKNFEAWFGNRLNKSSGREQPMTFNEIAKFNPYHDRLGRFASSGSATSFTWRPGASVAHDKAIQREKERTSSAGGG